MEKLLAYCGLDCAECPARKAHLTNDDALRAETAARWTKEFGFPFTAAMVDCTGCTQAGAKIGHCSDCGMRACGLAKGIANCGACAEYASCAKLGGFLGQVPLAKANLEAFRARKA
ncbi:MAG: hypothetical protein A2Z99_17385 [Treponema sp. GWB1_62_6]|nr:MAG: hypothetical protein A2Y36_12935 [Treponema sp. GWA1_62_8]OHE65307.1 MAG: hypothetical protein A2Z99_17385 [Treponema sp. GWB1_62_6]OHE67448.1 MAG: hypothetical protein A2001_07555 [Treponema sp. GWC1_61_84]OHE76760.1 MAG: hypothetical protein A2413_00050 [Treponema sp. RIFOXYC1_FULL_61_9]HCM28390.1 hypothetical protein [Treponema sp.]